MKGRFTLFCAAVALLSLNLISCAKDKERPVSPRNYSGKWMNRFTGFAGPLDYFTLLLNLKDDSTGNADIIYKATQHAYPPSPVRWKKMAGDSIRIVFAFDAYPAETGSSAASPTAKAKTSWPVLFRYQKPVPEAKPSTAP